MKWYSRLVAGFVISLAMPTSVFADEARSAHIVSPDKYQVLLDNDEVLVLKMTLAPGENDNWHRHNAETVYFKRGGKARIKTGVDKEVVLDIPDGYVMWHDTWEHQVFNVGDTSISAIIVERK